MLLLIIFGGGTFVFVSRLHSASTTSSTSGPNGLNGPSAGSSTTPTPSSVSLASAIPASWHEKDDPLSDNSQGYAWDEVSNLDRTCEFQNGVYVVQEEGTGAGGNLAFCLAGNTNYADFAFEVQMNALEGTAGGIVFRSGSKSAYYFVVGNPDNTTIALYVKDCPSTAPCRTLKNVTSNQLNGLFRKGPNDLNSLAVVAKGTTFAFFVNGQEVAQLTDRTYSQGQTGLGIGTGILDNLSGHTLEMSNAKIWTP